MGRRFFAFALLGPAFLFMAAACAMAAAHGGVAIPLGAYTLDLLSSDLGGLALAFALVGASAMGASAWAHSRSRKFGRVDSVGRMAAMVLAIAVVPFALALAIWPTALVRLSFFPTDPDAFVGYRFYLRGGPSRPLSAG